MDRSCFTPGEQPAKTIPNKAATKTVTQDLRQEARIIIPPGQVIV
jgi:hypothetical protein